MSERSDSRDPALEVLELELESINVSECESLNYQGIEIEEGESEEPGVLIEYETTTGSSGAIVLLNMAEPDGGSLLGMSDTDLEKPLQQAKDYADSREDTTDFGLYSRNSVLIRRIQKQPQPRYSGELSELSGIIANIVKFENDTEPTQSFISKLRDFHSRLSDSVKPLVRSSLSNDDEYYERVRDHHFRYVNISRQTNPREKLIQEELDTLAKEISYILINRFVVRQLVIEEQDTLREKYDHVPDVDSDFETITRQPPSPPESPTDDWPDAFSALIEAQFDLIAQYGLNAVYDEKTPLLEDIDLLENEDVAEVLFDLHEMLEEHGDVSGLLSGELQVQLYEELVPRQYRWEWGQFHTPRTVTRFLANWAIQDEDDEILDPGCGSGGFLTAGYWTLRQRKSNESSLAHREGMDQLTGIDIDQFPAHLAAVSLATQEISEIELDMDVRVDDFFNYQAEANPALADQRENCLTPKDAVIMNPPYARSEAVGAEYSTRLNETVSAETGTDAIHGNMDLFGYYLMHATQFVAEDGRLGVIVKNSIFQNDYAGFLQDHLLGQYSIELVVSTRYHRIIQTADINTVLLFLSKDSDDDANNQVRFVELFQSLEWFDEDTGLTALPGHLQHQETGEYQHRYRIRDVSQQELEGDGNGFSSIIRNKWMAYLRLSDQVMSILEENADDFTQLETLSSDGITNGWKSGATDFFIPPAPGESRGDLASEFDESSGHLIVTNDGADAEFSIPPTYWMEPVGDSGADPERYDITVDDGDRILVPRYIVRSTKVMDQRSISIDDAKEVVVGSDQPYSDLDSNFQEYVDWGVEAGFDQNSSVTGDPWYSLSQLKSGLVVVNQFHDDRYLHPVNKHSLYLTNAFHYIDVDEQYSDYVMTYLNSTLGALFTELMGRVDLGEGVLTLYGPGIKQLPIPDPDDLGDDLLDRFSTAAPEFLEASTESIQEELGASHPRHVDLDGINQERREIDRLIMEDLLGLTDDQQEHIYKEVLQLQLSRAKKAISDN